MKAAAPQQGRPRARARDESEPEGAEQRAPKRTAGTRPEAAAAAAADCLARALQRLRLRLRTPPGHGGTALVSDEACSRLLESCSSVGAAASRARLAAVASAFYLHSWTSSPWRMADAARAAALCHLALMRSATGGNADLADSLVRIVAAFLPAAQVGPAPFVVAAGYSSLASASEAIVAGAIYDLLRSGGCDDPAGVLDRGFVASSARRVRAPQGVPSARAPAPRTPGPAFPHLG